MHPNDGKSVYFDNEHSDSKEQYILSDHECSQGNESSSDKDLCEYCGKPDLDQLLLHSLPHSSPKDQSPSDQQCPLSSPHSESLLSRKTEDPN